MELEQKNRELWAFNHNLGTQLSEQTLTEYSFYLFLL